MRQALQGTARKFKIFMADSAAPASGKTGLTAFIVYLAKDGVADTVVTPTIVERGHGWYEVTPTVADRDTLGESAWTFTAIGAVDFPRLESVIAADAHLVAWGAMTADTDITDALIDVITTQPLDELMAVPPADASLAAKVSWIYQFLRNKVTQSSTERTLYASDDTTVVAVEDVGDTAGVFTKARQRKMAVDTLERRSAALHFGRQGLARTKPPSGAVPAFDRGALLAHYYIVPPPFKPGIPGDGWFFKKLTRVWEIEAESPVWIFKDSCSDR